MLQGTDQQVHELRVQMLGLRDEAQRASPALLQETSNRLSAVEKAVSTVEKAWETRVSAVESSTLSTFRDLREEHTRMDEAHAAFAQQVRAESARLSEAGKEVGVMIEAQARGLKAVQEDMVLRLKETQEKTLRVRELFEPQLRRIEAQLLAIQRAQDLKWQKMDGKFADDFRKIVQAIDSFRAAHEALKVSTDDHFAKLLAEDEKNLKRLWADIEANREHCDRHHEKLCESLGEEEHRRKEADEVLRSSLGALQQDLAHSNQALSDAIEKESLSREASDAALRAATAALREDAVTADHALGRRITLLAETLAEELENVRQKAHEASEAHVQRSTANKDSIQMVENQLEALVDDLACTQALLEDVQYTSGKEHALVQKAVADIRDDARAEVLERQAAITEVYRRLQMSREMVSSSVCVCVCVCWWVGVGVCVCVWVCVCVRAVA